MSNDVLVLSALNGLREAKKMKECHELFIGMVQLETDSTLSAFYAELASNIVKDGNVFIKGRLSFDNELRYKIQNSCTNSVCRYINHKALMPLMFNLQTLGYKITFINDLLLYFIEV